MCRNLMRTLSHLQRMITWLFNGFAFTSQNSNCVLRHFLLQLPQCQYMIKRIDIPFSFFFFFLLFKTFFSHLSLFVRLSPSCVSENVLLLRPSILVALRKMKYRLLFWSKECLSITFSLFLSIALHWACDQRRSVGTDKKKTNRQPCRREMINV